MVPIRQHTAITLQRASAPTGTHGRAKGRLGVRAARPFPHAAGKYTEMHREKRNVRSAAFGSAGHLVQRNSYLTVRSSVGEANKDVEVEGGDGHTTVGWYLMPQYHTVKMASFVLFIFNHNFFKKELGAWCSPRHLESIQ